MAYVTGTATNLADLKTKIIAGCTSNGWTLTSGILSKGSVYVEFTEYLTHALTVEVGTGQSGSSLTGSHPRYGLTTISNDFRPAILEHTDNLFVWPVNYHLHINTSPDEVVCVINYNGTYYQQLSFGTSEFTGVTGSGNWCTASCLADDATTRSLQCSVYFNNFNLCSAYSDYAFKLGLFADTSHTNDEGASLFNFGTGANDWRTLGVTTTSAPHSSTLPTGICGLGAAAILSRSPNTLDGRALMVPVRISYVDAVALKYVYPGDLTHVRYCELATFTAEQDVVIDTETWTIYPWLRRFSATEVSGQTHSGLMGYAVRKT